MKNVFLAITFMFVAKQMQSQTIRQIGQVAYFPLIDTLQSKKVERAASYTACYAQQIRLADSLVIFLNVTDSKQNYKFALDYDNIYGNSVDNKYYVRPSKDYQTMGIRITIPCTQLTYMNILKLLDYALTHFDILKQLFDKANSAGYYESKSHQLPRKKIKKILRSSVANAQVDLMKTCASLNI